MFTVQNAEGNCQRFPDPLDHRTATLGEHVATTLAVQLKPEAKSPAWQARSGLEA